MVLKVVVEGKAWNVSSYQMRIKSSSCFVEKGRFREFSKPGFPVSEVTRPRDNHQKVF